MDIKHLSEKEVKLLKEVMKDDKDKEDLPLRDVLLSIKPRYVRKIKEGKKVWEFRKKLWSNGKIIDKIYLYETSPTQEIVGYFTTNQIINAKPKHIWDLCSHGAGISKNQFFKYFQGHNEGYAIRISHLHFFESPIDPYEKIKGFHAPQNFMYITIDNYKKSNKQTTLDEHLGLKISKDQKAQLEALAKKRNKSLSKTVRELISDALKNLKETKPSKPPALNPPPGPNESKKKVPEKSDKSPSLDSHSDKWSQLTKEFKEKVEEIKEKDKNKSKVKK